MFTKSIVICYCYTHLLIRLANIAASGYIVGLHLPFARELVAKALADDSFMFLQASKENHEKSMQVWDHLPWL